MQPTAFQALPEPLALSTVKWANESITLTNSEYLITGSQNVAQRAIFKRRHQQANYSSEAPVDSATQHTREQLIRYGYLCTVYCNTVRAEAPTNHHTSLVCGS